MQIGRTIRCYTVEPLEEPVGQPRPSEVRDTPAVEPAPQPEPVYVLCPLLPRDAA